MRYRQIHLDFHTSDVIPEVGKDFDVQDFVKTLKDAHVNSINIFAKCHHGMCYYPTKVGRMHPGLDFDLLGTMIGELHKNDIKCPIYFPLGWEEDAANRTEWLEIGRDGIVGRKLPTESGYYTWRKLCLNNREYREHIKAQLKEIIENYEVDGLWFDIVRQDVCLCPNCVKEMKAMGLNPDSDTDVIKHDDMVLVSLQDELNDFVHSFNPEITTVYNTGWGPDGGFDPEHTIENRAYRQDHVEIESLPSGGWGYMHFPYLANFYNRDNRPVVGMNGKFHLSWGDHGSLKNQEALEFECFRMIANGCAASVGDQLHPRGQMNHSAYKRIGRVYEVIEQLEDYLEGSRKCADIGVIVSADFYDKDTLSDEGVLRMLMQMHYQFDLITVADDFDRYSLLILPDNIPAGGLEDKLRVYLCQGGRVLATYKSCSEALGIKYISDNEYTPAYMVIDEKTNAALGTSIDPLEYVCYETGAYVSVGDFGATDKNPGSAADSPAAATHEFQTVAFVGKPYYNRTAECFSSHRHFPFECTTDYPAILLSENVGYCAFPLFKDYITNGNKVFAQVVSGLIGKLMSEPVLRTDAPSFAETVLRRLDNKDGSLRGFALHILTYIPQRLTHTIDIVNEPALVENIKVGIKFSECREVRMVRAGRTLSFEIKDGYVNFVIPKVQGYEVIYVSTGVNGDGSL